MITDKMNMARSAGKFSKDTTQMQSYPYENVTQCNERGVNILYFTNITCSLNFAQTLDDWLTCDSLSRKHAVLCNHPMLIIKLHISFIDNNLHFGRNDGRQVSEVAAWERGWVEPRCHCRDMIQRDADVNEVNELWILQLSPPGS